MNVLKFKQVRVHCELMALISYVISKTYGWRSVVQIKLPMTFSDSVKFLVILILFIISYGITTLRIYLILPKLFLMPVLCFGKDEVLACFLMNIIYANKLHKL